MNVIEDRRDGVVLLRPVGQLTVTTQPALAQALGRALEQGERRFVFDFDQTGYIDSSGMAALAAGMRQVLEHGGDARAAGLNDDLRALFELTKLDTLLRISATADEAVAAL